MGYFDWLGSQHLEDTQDNFIRYLIEVLDYFNEQATEESKIYYRGE